MFCHLLSVYTSSTRTRRGGSCLKDIYETFLIYRTCMRRAPAKPVRACTLRKWCPVSHVTFQARRHTSHFSLHSSHFTLHTWNFTVHTSHFTVHTSHFSLLSSHSTLHTSHCTLQAPHFTLHSSHSTVPPQHKAHATSCSHSNAICHHSFKKRIELRTQEQPLVAKHIGGTIRDRNDPSRNRRTHEVPFIAACSHFTRKNTRFRAPASSPTQSPRNIMQPFQCDLPPQLQETHRTTHIGTTTRCKHIGGTIRDRNDPSRNRRTHEVPFIAACSHFTRKNTRFRAPASSPTQSPCNIMQPFQCDLPPQLQETHRTTHIGTTTRCKTHRRNNSRQKRPQPQPPHTRGTFHRRLQPLYTEKHKVSCAAFLPTT